MIFLHFNCFLCVLCDLRGEIFLNCLQDFSTFLLEAAVFGGGGDDLDFSFEPFLLQQAAFRGYISFMEASAGLIHSGFGVSRMRRRVPQSSGKAELLDEKI